MPTAWVELPYLRVVSNGQRARYADITLLPGTLGLSCKLDDSLLQSEIGFTPQYPMERGILETMNFVRRQAGLPLLEEKA